MSNWLRSCRVLVLAWAVLLAPQVSVLHALSHGLPGSAPHSSEGDKRGHAPAKVCDSCLALAQLGAALPSSFHWQAPEASPPAHRIAVPTAAAARVESAYDARAPPVALS